MKKILSVLMVLAMLMTGVAMADEKVTLSMWIWDDAQAPAMQAMIDAYEAKNPNVEVELTSVAGVTEYNTKMRAVFGSPSAPSVFWMNFNLGREYIPMNVVADLTDAGIDFTTLSAGITNAYVVDGKTYGVAKDTDSFAVYYNKALFDAAKVEYPVDTWTIDEFLATAKALTAGDIMGYGNSTSDRVMYAFLKANGGEIYEETEDGPVAAVNSEANIATLQKLMDAMAAGYMYNGAQMAETAPNSAFTSGKCAMVIDGSWMISQFADALGENLGVVEMPSGSVSKGSANHGIAFATTNANPHMEETIDFLKFLATDEAQALQAEVVIPASLKAIETWAEVYPNVNTTAFMNAISDYGFPIPLASVNPTQARTAIQEQVGYIMNGEYADAAAALEAMEEAINYALED